MDLLGGPAADREWLYRLSSLFPAPSIRHIHHVVFAVERLVGVAPWLAGVLDDRKALGRIAEGLRRAHAKGCLEQAAPESAFTGDFLRAGTLMAEQVRTARHLEALRAVVVACAWRWANEQQARKTSLDAIAAATRAIAKSLRAASRSGAPKNFPVDGALLADLARMAGDANPELPAQAAELSSEAFRKAWNQHALPELRSILRPAALPFDNGGPAPVLPGGSGQSSVKVGEKEPTNDASLVRQLDGYRRKLGPVAPGLEQEVGESVEEVVSPVEVLPALFVPGNRDARRIVRFQVKQAIWGRNRFLLPNHADALEMAVLAKVVGVLVKRLEDPDASPDHAGLIGLLFQALTGRTIKSLKAIRLVSDKSVSSESDRIDLLLKEGALRYPVFWQVPVAGNERPTYFQPSEEQKALLEDVRADYTLPLLRPLAATLERANGILRRFLALEPNEMEGAIRDAARAVGEALDLRITPGQVRASFAVHIFEQSRDLALTQLLAADSFGQSSAPLSYYAPRVDTLARTYWKFQERVTGEPAGPEPRFKTYRVGSKLQVRAHVAAEMARAFGAPLRQGVTHLLESGLAHEVHTAITRHVLGMLVAGLTHRPTEALLRLRRSDFSVEERHGAALFRDKIVDGAHDPRLVALPPLACTQIRAYLAHLEVLASTHADLAAHIRDVLKGDQPLFFKWDGGSVPGELKLVEWKAGLPPVWQNLPANWGRHWCRTKAVELGLRPELVNMQMGHLEAVGYPFSGASPTEPASFIEAIAPGWEQVVRSQGWQLLRGISSDERGGTQLLPPLRKWQKDAQDHAAQQADVAKRWRVQFIATMRTMRERALEDVLAHPVLVANGITERYANPASGQPRHGLGREDFERLRDSFLGDGDNGLELGLARATALCRVARVVNRRTSQSDLDPTPLLFPRRPLDNAFFPRMLTAVRQVRAMREHVADWSGVHKPGPWRHFPLACARVTLALSLFGFCEDPEQVAGAIARRGQARRSAAFPDLLLVPYGDDAHQVLPLRGAAAIAMAQLASKHGGDGFPGWPEIAPHLPAFLPRWAWPTTTGLDGSLPRVVTCLLETVAAANRFELSPAARACLGTGALSTQAHLREQVALLDGDPAGSLSREWLARDTEPAVDGHHGGNTGGSTGSARTQYLALHAALATGDAEITLPLTGVVIPSGQSAGRTSRSAVIAEIEAMLALKEPRLRLHPVTRMLAAWCKDMLLEGTERTKTPALSTVATYLSRIGGVLVEVVGHRRLDKIDEEELEQAYLAAVSSRRDPAPTASRALALQRFGRKHFELPEIDTTALGIIANTRTTSRADARVILPSEREEVFKCLERWAEGRGSGSALTDLRVYRQAKVFAQLILPTGARRSEILGLRARDLSCGDQGVRIRIRRNASRRLKTLNARRDVVSRLSQGRQAEVDTWIKAEAGRLAPAEAASAYLFPPVHEARGAEGRNAIAAACLEAIKFVTQFKSARIHHFRHLFAIEALSPIFLTSVDRHRLAANVELADTPTWESELALPRDLMAMATLLGHADPKTSLTWYHHVPFLLRSRPDAAMADRHLSTATLATLQGVTRDAIKASLKSRDGRARAEHLLSLRMAPRKPPVSAALESPRQQRGEAPQRWTARRMAHLLEAASRLGRLEPALLVLGGNTGDADALRAALLAQEMRLGRKLVEDAGMAMIPARPKRSVRPLAGASSLECWWDEHDAGLAERREQILSVARTVGQHMAPGDRDWIRIPESSQPEFLTLLREAGIPPDQVQRERIGAGLVRLRVERHGEITGQSPRPEPAGASVREAAVRYLGLSIKRVLVILLLVQGAQ